MLPDPYMQYYRISFTISQIQIDFYIVTEAFIKRTDTYCVYLNLYKHMVECFYRFLSFSYKGCWTVIGNLSFIYSSINLIQALFRGMKL